MYYRGTYFHLTNIKTFFGKIGSRDYFFPNAYKRVGQLVERDCQNSGRMVAPPLSCVEAVQSTAQAPEVPIGSSVNF